MGFCIFSKSKKSKVRCTCFTHSFAAFDFCLLRCCRSDTGKMQTTGVYKIKHFSSIVITVTLILIMSVEFSTELDLHGRHLTFIAIDVSIHR